MTVAGLDSNRIRLKLLALSFPLLDLPLKWLWARASTRDGTEWSRLERRNLISQHDASVKLM